MLGFWNWAVLIGIGGLLFAVALGLLVALALKILGHGKDKEK